MRFDAPTRRRGDENIVPMINVVFLLLVFFLMTAQIAPPLPEPIITPTGTGDAPAGQNSRLYIGASGIPSYMEATGQAAIDMILAQRPDRVTLYADRRLDASALVRIVNSITSQGTIAVDLVLGPQGGSDE